MKFTMPSLKPFWVRDKGGDYWSFVEDNVNWGTLGKNNLEIASNHPLLTPAIQFVSKIFSQAEFYIEDQRTKERIYDSEYVKLLNAPNYYQTKSDFLETLMFTQIACGQAIGWKRKSVGESKPNSIYLLNPYLIEYPSGFTTKMSVRNEDNSIRNKSIIYDRNGQMHEIKIRDLIFFYDLPNGFDTSNMFLNPSRLDGLKQTLINTNDSLIAKNVILKTNGKELFSGKVGSVQLSTDEKRDMQRITNSKYGLGKGRSRALITKADIDWKSLHIALRDLGLDESVKVDGNIIYTALHIPKDILSLEAKKTTYNNFKESMVSYIQNEMQSSLDSFCEAWNKELPDPNIKLRGTFEHLPIMQHILKSKWEGEKIRAEALTAYIAAGVPSEIALDLLGLDKTIKLEPPKTESTVEDNSENSEDLSGEDKWKLKKII